MSVCAEMLAVHQGHFSLSQVRALSERMVAELDPGGRDFWIQPERHALALAGDFEQRMLPQATGAQVLHISTVMLLWAPSYSRGPLPLFVRWAEWLERNIPGCTVFYGDDATEATEVFDAAKRAEWLGIYHQQRGG